MKVCTRCGKSKSDEEFAKKARSSDGLSPWCKACFAENAAVKYRENPEERERKARNRRNFRDANRLKVVEYLKTHPCVDCGETDIRVLEFDHLGLEPKSFNVSDKYAAMSWANLLAEIEKCEVVCANHHNIRTFERGGFWRTFVT